MTKFKRSAATIVSLLVALAGVGLAASPAQAVTTYWYAAGLQNTWPGANPTGITANVGAYNPALDTAAPGIESHTIMELAVTQAYGGAQNGQVVEVGWRKAAGDTGPRLFVSHWVNGAWQGYNAGFTQCNMTCGNTTDVWDTNDYLTAGDTYRFGLTYQLSNWYVIAYKANAPAGTAEFLGYWPGTTWSSASPSATFVDAPVIHAYGEVANTTLPLGCTDMGDGTLATSADGGLIGSVSAVGLASSVVDIDQVTTITDSSKYNFAAAVPGTNVRTVRAGGPGAC